MLCGDYWFSQLRALHRGLSALYIDRSDACVPRAYNSGKAVHGMALIV